MKASDLIPPYLDSQLQSLFLSKDDVLFAVPSDLSVNGLFAENWFILTKTNLVILYGKALEKAGARKTRGKRSKKDTENDSITYRKTDAKSYDLSAIKKLSVNDMVSGGVLIAQMSDEEEILLARFTSTRQKDFGVLCKLHASLQSGKTPDIKEIMHDQGKNLCKKCGKYFSGTGSKSCPKCMDKRSIFKRILSFAAPYKARVVLLLLLMFTAAAANVFRPYLSGNILFDEVLSSEGRYYGRVGAAVLLIAGAQLLFLLLSIAQGRVNAHVSTNIVYSIKVKVFKAMQDLSMSFYNSKETGGLLTRVNNDSNHLTHFFHDGIPYVLVNTFVILGTIGVMLSMNVALTFFVLLPVPLLIFVSRVIFPHFNRLHTKRYRATRYLNALTNDTLTGFRVVKAFGKEKNEIERFGSANVRFTDTSMQVSTYASTAFPLMHALLSMGTFIVWGFGGYQVIQGRLTFGSLIAFTMYLGMLYQPMQFLSDMVGWWSDTMTAGQRIFEIIDAEPEIFEKEDAKPLETVRGHVKLQNVTFSYEPNKPVIKNVNIDIQPGETIGLVGKSGAGKSTLANMISRLYDAEEGEILIDGINLKDYSLDDLHEKIGMVMQDTFLFSGSVAENIAYGLQNVNPLDIIRASMAAGAHDFIMKLPDRYDTIIGKNGQDLSGGERQRVSIARTILHDPDILILDEATASVDTETEIKIQNALDYLIQSKTTLVIAHRLSTLRNADRIVVIDNGEIIEYGSHDELIQKEGEFYKMLEQQKKALEIGGVIK